jgi:hypothetical protein
MVGGYFDGRTKAATARERLVPGQDGGGPGEVQLLGDNNESPNQLQVYEFTRGYVLSLRVAHRRISSSPRRTLS